MSGKKIAQVLFAASAAWSMLIPSAAALATTADDVVTPDRPMISDGSFSRRDDFAIRYSLDDLL